MTPTGMRMVMLIDDEPAQQRLGPACRKRPMSVLSLRPIPNCLRPSKPGRSVRIFITG